MKRKSKLWMEIFDIVIPLLICMCIIYLNNKGKAIGKEYVEIAQTALFVQEGNERRSDRELQEILLDNIHGPTKRIELYDDSLSLMFQISFSGPPNGASVDKFHRLRGLVENSREFSGSGQATMTVDGITQSVYYEWLTNSEDQQRLVIVYSALGDFIDYGYMDYIALAGVILVGVLIIAERKERKAERLKEVINVKNAIDKISRI